QADETVATAQPDKPATVATKPEPAAAEAGTLEITSEPVGELIIDGEPAGTTPYEEPLPIGKHTLEIVAEGYKPWTKEIEIQPGKSQAFDVRLEAVPASTVGDHKPTGKKPTGTKPTSVEPEPKPEPELKPEPKPEPKPEKDNPFLPTKKKTDNGPFLPTEK
ncbi:MAG TPA: PEGA domain-containing protein, partial [Enhygromyxa sp.]|nr:PEGA domain-containing protein [Enhygromyxa sp.]